MNAGRFVEVLAVLSLAACSSSTKGGKFPRFFPTIPAMNAASKTSSAGCRERKRPKGRSTRGLSCRHRTGESLAQSRQEDLFLLCAFAALRETILIREWPRLRFGLVWASHQPEASARQTEVSPFVDLPT